MFTRGKGCLTWDLYLPFRVLPPSQPGGATIAHFARLSQVGESAGHYLASPADLPTKGSYSASGANRLVFSRQMLPSYSYTDPSNGKGEGGIWRNSANITDGM